MSMVSGGWRCWRVYFSYEAGDEVLTACCYLRADGAFCAEKAHDSCPVWMRCIPLQFPWHFVVIGPYNCSVLVRATVLNSKLFQPRCSGMTGPVMKLSADLTEYLCLWRVTMPVVYIQSLTVCWEKLHQARPKKVLMCLKVKGCNIQCWDEQSRTWSPALDTCV